MAVNIIPQGEQAVFNVRSNRVNFDFGYYYSETGTSKHNREKRQKVHQHIEEEQMREMESQKTLHLLILNV